MIFMEQNFNSLAEKTEKLERDIANLNAGMKRLEQKLDKILSSIGNSHTAIDDVSATVSEVKNNLRLFNQSDRQLLNEINSNLLRQIQIQFDNFSKKSLTENQLTKDDLKAVESFLRLIAANQMIQETYLETK